MDCGAAEPIVTLHASGDKVWNLAVFHTETLDLLELQRWVSHLSDAKVPVRLVGCAFQTPLPRSSGSMAGPPSPKLPSADPPSPSIQSFRQVRDIQSRLRSDLRALSDILA